MKKTSEEFDNGINENNDKRKSIQSVEIGVRVLLALVETGGDEGAFLREVAEHSGLSRSQAHRYLLSFVNTGVAEQHSRAAFGRSFGRNENYRLAFRVGRLRPNCHSLDRWWNAAVYISAHGIGLAIADIVDRDPLSDALLS